MFGRLFSQTADGLFNQAVEKYGRVRYFFREEKKIRNELSEVVSLCQLSVQKDKRLGDAHVLLANALVLAAYHGLGRSDQERHEFLCPRDKEVDFRIQQI